MALIACWECGKQISAAARSCPHCGAPAAPAAPAVATPPAAPQSAPRTSPFLRGCLIATGAILATPILLVMLGSWYAGYRERQSGGGNQSLDAEVRYVAPGPISVRNRETVTWEDCDLGLNTDYSIKRITIGAGETVQYPTWQFAKSDGTIFNTSTTRPLQLFVYCRRAPTSTRSGMVLWN